MARDTDDLTPLTGKAEMIDWMAAGCKPQAAFRIGTEHEKFVFDLMTRQAIGYEGPRGIEAILRGMERVLGWEPILDEERIIGLAGPGGGGAISLEPGGQFELSGAPLECLHQTACEVASHLAQLREIATPMGIGFLGLGFTPDWTLDQTPQMPKSRYKIMRAYMPKVGTRGLDMMHRTSTIQVNLDFSSEADMVRKMRVGLALQPLATALFAASPFKDGAVSGAVSERGRVWLDTDNQRAGGLAFAFDEGFGFEAYADWALSVPMYFVKRGATYHDVSGTSFMDLMQGTNPKLPGERAVLSDWINHLSTLFPDVRLKRFLEMRGADCGPSTRITALPAFWVGLLYDETALAAAEDLIRGWTPQAIAALRASAPVEGLKATIAGRTLKDIAGEALAISRAGLEARARLDGKGESEARYLDVLDAMVASGRTLADDLIARYNGPWAGDVMPIYRELAY